MTIFLVALSMTLICHQWSPNQKWSFICEFWSFFSFISHFVLVNQLMISHFSSTTLEKKQNPLLVSTRNSATLKYKLGYTLTQMNKLYKNFSNRLLQLGNKGKIQTPLKILSLLCLNSIDFCSNPWEFPFSTKTNVTPCQIRTLSGFMPNMYLRRKVCSNLALNFVHELNIELNLQRKKNVFIQGDEANSPPPKTYDRLVQT